MPVTAAKPLVLREGGTSGAVGGVSEEIAQPEHARDHLQVPIGDAIDGGGTTHRADVR